MDSGEAYKHGGTSDPLVIWENVVCFAKAKRGSPGNSLQLPGRASLIDLE